MALWIWTLSILSWFCVTLSRNEELKYFRSTTELNHLTLDNDTGTIYLGVVNALYQLTENLDVMRSVETGPRKDNKKCTPPIDENQCKEAVLTDNYNKLLLLNKADKTVVVCGSLFKGICAIRDLEDIRNVKYYVDSSGEKSFVASNDENVSTVGLITSLNNDRVLFVGKGNGPNDNGIIIGTRQLYDRDGKDIFEMYTDSAAVKSAYHSSSTQQFVAVFEDKNYVYFIFNQQEKQPINNRTLIARLCKDDAHCYSYFEMDLGCKDGDGAYDHCHSAYVTTPGEELAVSMAQQRQTTDALSDDKVLLALFSKVNKDKGSLKSAMCVFSLSHINEKMEKNRNDCYTKKNTSSFYKLFAAENPCASHGLNASKNFPCGSEHLPYLLGSKNGVIEKPVLQKEGMNLTAVAVAVENGHTVAFLGTSDGNILKVFLSSTATEYSSLTIELNKPIKNDLVLDKTQENLYVMTTDKVHRLPVQDCHKYSDCEKCTQARDPYSMILLCFGFCSCFVRCTKKADCGTADKENHWLWSPSGTCMTIISADPLNMSRRAPVEVELTVSPLPTLTESDKFFCTFGEKNHYAQLKEGVIICDPPDIIPPTPKGQDHVSVPLQLTFGKNKIFFASHTYPFYDCEEAMNLFENQPCYSCANNRWNCQWDWRRHICEESSSIQDVIKQNMEEECPQFLNPNPPVIPMEYQTTVYFEGRHLGYYQDNKFVVGNSQFEFEAPVDESDEGKFSFMSEKFSYSANETLQLNLFIRTDKVKIDSKLMVTLYNCSYGRSDCSLCLAAHRNYKCVWCEEEGKPSKCVYEKLCHTPPTDTCPHPEITRIEPKTGPLSGGILLTIMGSNLGITAEDVKNVTVADKECLFKEEFYSVSTRIVCQVGPMNEPKQGQIEVNINGKLGKSPSEVLFTYQQPHTSQVRPEIGPQAGGTTLTITGTNLATGSKEDVQVSVGSQPCNVTEFGDEIVCITGPNSKVEDVLVTMDYGGTAINVPHLFSYSENPTVTKFLPVNSFSSGGRNITVTGTGFELIQSFSLVVYAEHPEAGKMNLNRFDGKLVSRLNETTVVFSSPPILEDPENYKITTTILMDHYHLVVKNESHSFAYVADPTFETFTDGIKKQVNKLINAKGSNLNKAMTIDEAQAFVGDEPCNIKTLTETDLHCEPPEVQPQPKKRQKRDTINNLPEFIVKFGLREWILRRVEYDTRVSDIPLNLILPLVLIPMIAIIVTSMICYRRKSQQAEREYEKIKSQLEGLEESVRDRCKKEFTGMTDTCTPFIHTLENQREFSARAKVYFASLLTVALHGKLEYYTDIMKTLFLELMEQYVVAKNPKLMLRRSETVVERMLSNCMSICLYQYLKDNAGEPLYKLFKAIKHQVEKGPVDAVLKKAKYTLNDTGLLGDDVEYTQLTVNVYVQDGGTDSIPVKVLNCDTISQVKEKIIDQVYRNLPCSQWPKAESVVLEWRPGSTAQILSDLDLTSQRDGRWKRINTLMHYNARDGATLSKMGVSQQPEDNQQDVPGERHALLEDENKVWHLVRPVDEIDEGKSKRGSMKEKERTKAITEIYLTRLLSVKGTLQQFVDNFFHSVLNSNHVVPPAVKYFFDFLDEQAEKHDIKDEDTIHIWKTNSLPLRFWVNILKNPHFIFDVHVHEVVDASLSVIAQTFMDACTRTEHKLSRDSPSNKLLYAKEISNYKKMVEDYYKGIRQMVPVSDQDMSTHLAEISWAHTDSLNTLVALHQLYQFTNKYYDEIINALEEDPAAQKMQLAFRLQQIAAALENKVTDL
ncbi:LOW QUALITY PROTEIN: plexin-B2-like [Podargus strigoides]